MFNENKCPASLLPKKETQRVCEDSDFTALTDEKSLKNAIAVLCNNLCHPVAVFDYYQLQTDNKTAKKLESEVNPFSLRTSCSLLRIWAGDDLCIDCDRFHASCMDIEQGAIEEKIHSGILNRPQFFYPNYEKNLPHVLLGFDRPIIEYHCPILGYRELVFPIKYKDRLFGTLFVGQIMVYSEGDKEKVREIRKGFFEKNDPEELFNKNIEKHNSTSAEDDHFSPGTIKGLIMEYDNNTVLYDRALNFGNIEKGRIGHYYKSYKTKEEYNTFLKKVCDEIGKMEIKLSQEYEDRRERYFQSVMKDITFNYIRKYSSINSKSFSSRHEQRMEELKRAWELLEDAVAKIKEKKEMNFVENIIVYGDGQALRIVESNTKKAQFSLREKPRGMSYDFSFTKLLESSESLNSLDKPEIMEGLKGGSVSAENSVLILWRDIAMLLQVRDLETHRTLYLTLCHSIGKNFGRINSIIALCTANLMKEKLLLTMRMYRHENAHISARLKDNMTQYFGEDGSQFIPLHLEKRKRVLNDTQNAIQLISNIADKIGLITGSINEYSTLVRDRIQLDVSDMLYKWQSMFSHELEDRNLDIVVLRNTEADNLPGVQLSEMVSDYISDITGDNKRSYERADRFIETNPRLFELLIYNLIDNAVKYAYRGTNIYLIWCRVGNKYELSVTSYGPEMKKGGAMYELYARGSSHINRHQQGDGLGLYVVKRIAQLLQLRVDHNSEKIARYNLPLISWYQKTDFSSLPNYQKISLLEMDDYDRKQAQFAINKNPETTISERDVTRVYLQKRINLVTWRTTFRVQIPL